MSGLWPAAGTYRALGYLLLDRDPDSDAPAPADNEQVNLAHYEAVYVGPPRLLAGMRRGLRAVP